MPVVTPDKKAPLTLRSATLIVAALACLVYLVSQALHRRREGESLEMAAGNVLNAILQGDGGTLYRYMPEDEKEPLGVKRGDIERMTSWAHERMQGYKPTGPVLREEGSDTALILKQYLEDSLGRQAFVRVHIRTGPNGPVAPLIPHTLAMAAISTRVPITRPRESSVVRASKLLGVWKSELPTLNSFCTKIRRGSLDGPVVSWEDLIIRRTDNLEQLKSDQAGSR